MGRCPLGCSAGNQIRSMAFYPNDKNGPPDDPFDIWKYADDTTVSEIIIRGHDSSAQTAVNKVVNWSKESLLQLNGKSVKN